jgi:hypothetical protein
MLDLQKRLRGIYVYVNLMLMNVNFLIRDGLDVHCSCYSTFVKKSENEKFIFCNSVNY